MMMIAGTLAPDEALIDAYDNFRRLKSIPIGMLRLILTSNFFVDEREKLYIKAYLKAIDQSTDSLRSEQTDLRKVVIKKFTDAGVEICFMHGLFPAIRKNTAKDLDFMCLYCYIWNYLNFPVGVVPISTVRENEQQYESQFIDKLTAALALSMEGSAGLPVGIQVIGLPWHDELVVEAMVDLEGKLISRRKSYFILNY